MLVTHNIKVAARSQRVIYMRDGEIIDEKKFDSSINNMQDIKSREMELSKWLINLGF